MRWTDEQRDQITEAAMAACPGIAALPAGQIAAWEERAEATGVGFDAAMAWLNEAIVDHRKGELRPQPGDVLQAFRNIANQFKRTGSGGPGGRLSTEAMHDLPRITALFTKLPKGREGFYGGPVSYGGPKPYPPAGVVQAAYEAARQNASTMVEPSPRNPRRKFGEKVRRWDYPKAHAIIARAITQWLEGKENSNAA